MPPEMILVAIAAAALLLAVSVGGEGKGMVLSLERASHKGVGMSQLRHRDRVRHGRFLQQQPGPGVVDFPVEGTYDPYLVGYIFVIFIINSVELFMIVQMVKRNVRLFYNAICLFFWRRINELDIRIWVFGLDKREIERSFLIYIADSFMK